MTENKSAPYILLPLSDAKVYYVPNFFAREEADELLKSVEEEVVFSQKPNEQRPTALIGHKQYKYARNTENNFTPLPWTKTTLAIKQKVALWMKENIEYLKQKTDFDPYEIHNVCLLNKYENGKVAFGFHSDREEVGNLIPLASISLGAERQFVFSKKKSKIDIASNNGIIISLAVIFVSLLLLLIMLPILMWSSTQVFLIMLFISGWAISMARKFPFVGWRNNSNNRVGNIIEFIIIIFSIILFFAEIVKGVEVGVKYITNKFNSVFNSYAAIVDGSERYSMILGHGSMLVMADNCHENYLHGLPQDKKIKNMRLNLTFRHSRD